MYSFFTYTHIFKVTYTILALCVTLLPVKLLSQDIYQEDSKTISVVSTDTNKTTILAYPIIFYLPETRIGGGAAGFINFKFKGENPYSNPSQLQFSLNYTQNRQLICSFPFELYKNNNSWKARGELSYFIYQYNFYGLNIDSRFEDKETYRANLPRIRLDILRAYKKLFVGLRYRFDAFDFKSIKNKGLVEGQIAQHNGSRLSGIGALFQLDTRDFIYNPNSGLFGEFEVYGMGAYTGAQFKYTRISLDVSKYITLRPQYILAMHTNLITIFGQPPFYDMPFFGSPRLMRGTQDRRFIGPNLCVIQGELRMPLYRRFSSVLFTSIGTVSQNFEDILSNRFRSAYGLGLRFLVDKKARTRLRLDYGFTKNEGGAFYVTVNDAF